MSAKPRPTDDEPDEQPRKRRADDDADEDDRPRSKRHSRRDDDEEDRPRKKKSSLPLVLGILAGVLLLCGGGVAGVWFGLIVPAAQRARAENDRKEAELAEALKKQLEGIGQVPPPDSPPSETKPDVPKPGETKPKPDEDKAPDIAITADELVDNIAKYDGKTVTVRVVAL